MKEGNATNKHATDPFSVSLAIGKQHVSRAATCEASTLYQVCRACTKKKRLMLDYLEVRG